MIRLFQQRKRDRERAAAVAEGRGPKLAERFSDEARVKLLFAIGDVTPAAFDAEYPFGRLDALLMMSQLHGGLLRRWGKAVPRLQDFPSYVQTRATPDELADLIEQWFVTIDAGVEEAERLSGHYFHPDGYSPMRAAAARLREAFRARINEILDDHDIAFQIVGQAVVPRSSIAMHATVVEPVMALLAGDPRYGKVEQSYQAALSELKPGGDPADAITDAARAVQEALVAAGAQGNALGPLLTDARKRKLLGPYDSKLAEGIQTIGEWISADRSARGDAHVVGEASREDAWLAVRVSGALILRLAAGGNR